MAWVAITEADIRTCVSSDELAAYRSRAVDDGAGQDEDVLPRQIEQVAAFVRRYVFSCRSNYEQAVAQVGGIAALGEHTIPPGLMHLALALMVPVIQGRVGGYTVDPNELRKDSRRDALEALEQIAQCKVLADEAWPLLSEEELRDLKGDKDGSETPRVTKRKCRAVVC